MIGKVFKTRMKKKLNVFSLEKFCWKILCFLFVMLVNKPRNRCDLRVTRESKGQPNDFTRRFQDKACRSSGRELNSNSKGWWFDSLPLQIPQCRVNICIERLFCVFWENVFVLFFFKGSAIAITKN